VDLILSPKHRWRWQCGFLLGLLVPTAAAAEWNPLAAMRAVRELRAQLEAVENELSALPELQVAAQAHQRIGFHGRAGERAVLTLDLGRTVRPEEVVLFPARVSDPALNDSVAGFPTALRCLLSDSGAAESFVLCAEWREEADGTAREMPLLRLPVEGLAGRYLRVEVMGSRQRAGRPFFTLGEVVVLEAGVNRALGAAVAAGPAIVNAPRWMAENLTDGFLWCGALVGTVRSTHNGFHSAIETHPGVAPKWVEVDFGQRVPLDEIRLVPARPADFADVAGFGFPPTFRVLASPDESGGELRPIYGTGNTAFPNPGDATVCLPGRGVTARRVRVEASWLWQRTADYIFALAELQAFSGGRNVALGRPVQASDEVVTPRWSREALVDGFGSERELLDWPAWLAAVERRMAVQRSQSEWQRQLGAALEVSTQAWRRGTLAVGGCLALAGVAVLWWQHFRQSRERERLRERIARDLHDDVGSQLSHLALLAEHQGRLGAGGNAALAEISHGARDAQQSMRDLVWLLEGEGAEAGEFTARLRALCQRMLAPAVAGWRIEADGAPPRLWLPLAWSREVLLFVKEALSNCARHSGASTATVRLGWSAQGFAFSVVDDGRGFDERAPGFTPGAGLRNLRRRAEALRGRCEIASAEGNGTRICLHAPLPSRAWWSVWFSLRNHA
jgi:signal transduction histidine kinase